jgi:glycolate oxidase FAD binding subunit
VVTAPAVLTPDDIAGMADTLREIRSPLVVRGAGTKDDWSLGEPEVVLSTKRLVGVVLHDPADGVIVVRAGTSLANTQKVLARHGQWLAIDPPLVGDGATIGGIFSANDAGPRRLAYGTLRDMVLGVTLITGDGFIAKTGGRVIKNVAGFDLARLYCGAFGTLGLVAELAFRVQPIRPNRRTIRVRCPATRVGPFLRAMRVAGVEPSAADWFGPSDATMVLRIEQRTERAATAQAKSACEAALSEGLGAEVLNESDGREVWQHGESILAGSPGDTTIRIVSRPSDLPQVAHGIFAACTENDTDVTLVSHAVLGVHTARLRGGRPGDAIAVVRAQMALLGGYVTTRRRGPDLGPEVPRWGEPPPGFAIMRRVKHELDPRGRCAPGTFVGGI